MAAVPFRATGERSGPPDATRRLSAASGDSLIAVDASGCTALTAAPAIVVGASTPAAAVSCASRPSQNPAPPNGLDAAGGNMPFEATGDVGFVEAALCCSGGRCTLKRLAAGASASVSASIAATAAAAVGTDGGVAAIFARFGKCRAECCCCCCCRCCRRACCRSWYRWRSCCDVMYWYQEG